MTQRQVTLRRALHGVRLVAWGAFLALTLPSQAALWFALRPSDDTEPPLQRRIPPSLHHKLAGLNSLAAALLAALFAAKAPFETVVLVSTPLIYALASVALPVPVAVILLRMMLALK